jgi:lipoyl(octanoyl) transferase
MTTYSTLTPIHLVHLGRVDYLPTYLAMQDFTSKRSLEPLLDVCDELWICEHNPVYTQGLAGKPEHILKPGNVPVVQTNRGGQVTYHGPGQVVAYPLIDLKRAGYFVKEYVYRIEEAVIRTLMHFGVTGHRVAGAPGIYVRLDDPTGHALLPQRPMIKTDRHSREGGNPVDIDPRLRGNDEPTVSASRHDITHPNFTGLGKIGALGIKVSRNCTYHGVALNVAMDLEPYLRINACGYQGLQTVDLSTIGVFVSWQEVADVFSQKLVAYLAP